MSINLFWNKVFYSELTEENYAQKRHNENDISVKHNTSICSFLGYPDLKMWRI